MTIDRVMARKLIRRRRRHVHTVRVEGSLLGLPVEVRTCSHPVVPPAAQAEYERLKAWSDRRIGPWRNA